jgi:hypothetical protein
MRLMSCTETVTKTRLDSVANASNRHMPVVTT